MKKDLPLLVAHRALQIASAAANTSGTPFCGSEDCGDISTAGHRPGGSGGKRQRTPARVPHLKARTHSPPSAPCEPGTASTLRRAGIFFPDNDFNPERALTGAAASCAAPKDRVQVSSVAFRLSGKTGWRCQRRTTPRRGSSSRKLYKPTGGRHRAALPLVWKST
jgi:hypothetical protein